MQQTDFADPLENAVTHDGTPLVALRANTVLNQVGQSSSNFRFFAYVSIFTFEGWIMWIGVCCPVLGAGRAPKLSRNWAENSENLMICF
jgi:hypothetical protein